MAASGPATVPAPAPASARYMVPGLQRGLDLLRAFTHSEPAHNASDLARRLGIPRSTVFRLLQTLEQMGFLLKAENGRDYRLGPAVLSIGFEFLAGQDIIEQTRSALQRLRDDTGCSVHLALRDQDEVVYIAKYSQPSRFQSSVHVGTRLPAHATALGRVFLAALDDVALTALYQDRPLTAHSAQTPRSLAALKSILRQDRKRGYAISESYFESGICSIACPLMNHNRQVVAAINLIALEGRVSAEELHGKLLQRILATASELTEHLRSVAA